MCPSVLQSQRLGGSPDPPRIARRSCREPSFDTGADQLVLYRDSTRRRHQPAPSAVKSSRQGRHRRQNGRCSSPTVAGRATEARSLQVQSNVCRRASCMPCHAGSLWANADLAGLFGRKVARSGCNSPRASPASQHPYIAKRMESVCAFSKAPLGCPPLQVSVRFTATRQHPHLCCIASFRQVTTQNQGVQRSFQAFAGMSAPMTTAERLFCRLLCVCQHLSNVCACSRRLPSLSRSLQTRDLRGRFKINCTCKCKSFSSCSAEGPHAILGRWQAVMRLP